MTALPIPDDLATDARYRQLQARLRESPRSYALLYVLIGVALVAGVIWLRG